jgi:hypothetical protein
MKKQTFSEEILRSFPRFTKHMDPELEAGIEFMAQRLLNSGLLSEAKDTE